MNYLQKDIRHKVTASVRWVHGISASLKYVSSVPVSFCWRRLQMLGPESDKRPLLEPAQKTQGVMQLVSMATVT